MGGEEDTTADEEEEEGRGAARRASGLVVAASAAVETGDEGASTTAAIPLVPMLPGVHGVGGRLLPPDGSDDRFRMQDALQGLSRENEGAFTEPFLFVQTADSQLGLYDFPAGPHRIRPDGSLERAPASSSPRALPEEDIESLKAMVRQCNALRPRFIVMCGDLCNALPLPSDPAELAEFQAQLGRTKLAGTEETEARFANQAWFEAQSSAWKRAMAEVDTKIPVVCVCGNHDVGLRPTPFTLRSWSDRFGADHFSFWVGGVCFLVLNSQVLYDGQGNHATAAEEHLDWLERTLRAAARGEGEAKNQPPAEHIIVFQHIPWFDVRGPEEEPANPLSAVGLEERRRAMGLFEKYKVAACFAGHIHENMINGKVRGPDSVARTSIVKDASASGGYRGGFSQVLTTAVSPGGRFYIKKGATRAERWQLPGLLCVTVHRDRLEHEVRVIE